MYLTTTDCPFNSALCTGAASTTSPCVGLVILRVTPVPHLWRAKGNKKEGSPNSACHERGKRGEGHKAVIRRPHSSQSPGHPAPAIKGADSQLRLATHSSYILAGPQPPLGSRVTQVPDFRYSWWTPVSPGNRSAPSREPRPVSPVWHFSERSVLARCDASVGPKSRQSLQRRYRRCV